MSLYFERRYLTDASSISIKHKQRIGRKTHKRGKKIKEIDNGEASLSLSKIRYYAIDHGRK
jgi:hypothetical protein